MSQTVAYFSAEYSLADDLPTYAGGLGVLAADTVMQAGDDGRDFYALGLMYYEAFSSTGESASITPDRLAELGFELIKQDGQTLTVEVPIDQVTVRLRGWRRRFGTAQLILLDTDDESGMAPLTRHLYDGHPEIALGQEVALAFGGVAMLRALGIKPDVYHLNEGHMAPVALAVAAAEHSDLSLKEALDQLRPRLVATKHTILAASGLHAKPELSKRLFGPVLAPSGWTIDDLLAIAAMPDGQYADNKLLMTVCGRSSGVSEIHVRCEAREHPGSPLITITNGVYAPRWRGRFWPEEPAKLNDEDLLATHAEGRHALVKYVAKRTGTQLDPDKLTVVWARRMVAYKRPDLLVSDLNRLGELAANSDRPMQFIVAGRANPADLEGTRLMNLVIEASKAPELEGRFAYLPGYNLASATLLVQGADLWLNTPLRGMEACGTSGMKAGLNGAVQLSTSDGWFDEVDRRPLGWELPEHAIAADLYDILEREVAPMFYDDKAAWAAKMRNNIALIEQQFSAKRMLQDYFSKLYFPAE